MITTFMAEDIDDLRGKLISIDSMYYNNLDDKAKKTNKEIVKQVARDALRKSEESFQKGTPEDVTFGIMYRKIAKELLDTL
jgi:hypothetical protein